MTERPILFSGPMMRAVLDGRKTQTRRVVKPQPKVEMFPLLGRGNEPTGEWAIVDYPRVIHRHARCPYGVPGDRLWVREPHAIFCVDGASAGIGYRADHPAGGDLSKTDGGYNFLYLNDPTNVEQARRMVSAEKWRPSIHMPRWASRITLDVRDVRVQRVQSISEEDAVAEGVEPNWVGPLDKGPNGRGGEGWSASEDGWRNYLADEDGEPCYTARDSFHSLWDSIYGPGAWERNDWVLAITFRRIDG